MTYEVVKYRPEFKRQVAELQRHLWSPDPALNAAYFAWKHEQNSYVETPLIDLGLHGGQVMGMRWMFGARWQVGDPPRTFLAPCAGDLVVAPDHRNRGLVSKILEAALSDFADRQYGYVFSLSASPATQLGSLMTGWRGAGSLAPAHRRPTEAAGRVGPWTAAWRRARRLDTVSGRIGRLVDRWGGKPRPFRALDRNGARGGREASRHLTLESAPRPEVMATLIERIGGDGRIRHVRDHEYIAWRFRSPRSLYRFLFWADAELRGYLVLQAAAQRRRRPVRIVDWEATETRVRVDLLQAAIQWGQFDDLAIWSATLSEEARALLREAGFNVAAAPASIGLAYRGRTFGSALLVRPIRPEMPPSAEWAIAGRPLLDLAHWDLRMIYSDAF